MSIKMCMASASLYLNNNPILDAPKIEKQKRNMSRYNLKPNSIRKRNGNIVQALINQECIIYPSTQRP
jgi:hypothetical protein